MIGYRKFPFAGWLVQRDIGKKLTLGTEVFYHGPEGLATPQTGSAALLDFGRLLQISRSWLSIALLHTATPSRGKAKTTPTWGFIGPGASKPIRQAKTRDEQRRSARTDGDTRSREQKVCGEHHG